MCWYRRRAGVCAVVSSRSIVEISPIASTRPARDARAPVLASRIVAKDFFESTHLRVFVGRVDGDGRATSDARPRTRLVASILVASSSLTRCSRIARAPSRRVRTRASFFPLRASPRLRAAAIRARGAECRGPPSRVASRERQRETTFLGRAMRSSVTVSRVTESISATTSRRTGVYQLSGASLSTRACGDAFVARDAGGAELFDVNLSEKRLRARSMRASSDARANLCRAAPGSAHSACLMSARSRCARGRRPRRAPDARGRERRRPARESSLGRGRRPSD
jgi:hypothetical protein